MNKKVTVQTIRKRLDTLLKVVRYYGSHDGITNRCATCQNGMPIPIKELQCGHFIKRGNQALKYVSINLMPQCRRCNHFLDGAQDKAACYIIHKYGVEEFDWLIETDRQWLQGLISPLKKDQLIKYYNYWLGENRRIEEKWNVQLVPKTWKPLDSKGVEEPDKQVF